MKKLLNSRRTTALDDNRELLTVKEIAELDRCSEKTVYRAIRAGVLQSIRLGPNGQLLRISRDAHEAYRRGLRL